MAKIILFYFFNTFEILPLDDIFGVIYFSSISLLFCKGHMLILGLVSCDGTFERYNFFDRIRSD